MKTLLKCAILILVLLLVVACVNAVAPTQASTQTPAPTANATPQTTRAVDTARGKVTVPTDPQRVVALSAESLSALLDMGLMPIGVSDGAEDWVLAKYAAMVKTIDKVGEAPEANLEKIAALQPDLIVSANVPNDAFAARGK